MTELAPSPLHSTNLQGVSDPYLWFLYILYTICNHNQGSVSGSMNDDSVHTKYISQQPKH